MGQTSLDGSGLGLGWWVCAPAGAALLGIITLRKHQRDDWSQCSTVRLSRRRRPSWTAHGRRGAMSGS
jgi:hypothetical protein